MRGRRWHSLLAWLPAALLASAATLEGQTIRGAVYDEASGRPVAAAEVALETLTGERLGGAVVDADGSFLMRAPGTGRYRLVASALGYRVASTLVSVTEEEAAQTVLQLSPLPFELDSLTATARRRFPYLERAGFYRREERGWGSFYDQPEVERIPAAFPRHLFRQLPGVSTTPAGQIRMRNCAPAIILDGMHLRGVVLDDMIAPDAIQGIEVYDSPATVPVEFRRGPTCGAVVIWTRRRD